MIIVDAIILDRTNNQIKIEVSISMFIGLEFWVNAIFDIQL